MSRSRILRNTARVAAALLVAGLMSSCAKYSVAPPAPPTCMPIAHSAQRIPPPAGQLDPVQLADPNPEDMTWSCLGKLFAWTTIPASAHQAYPGSFQRFPALNPWCRKAVDASGHEVQYRHCRDGSLIFSSEPDVQGRSFWLDPALGYWLSMEGTYQSTLEGYTVCHGWQPIVLDSQTGGPFFLPRNQRCLDHPASLSLLNERIGLWSLPAGFSWYDISHVPVCQTAYQRPDCATLP